MPDIEIPGSLELLDVAGNGMACERFLWIRGLSDPSLAPKARIDLIDDLQRFPGELLHLVARDGTAAARTFTILDENGAGSCYLSIFARVDPGEPLLGDLVDFASARALAGGVAQVRCGDTEDRPHIIALQARHGFVIHESWRRFHVDTFDAPEATLLPSGTLPDGIHVATLAARPDLAQAAHDVSIEGLADTPGDFPRADTTLEAWLGNFNSSPIMGRDLVLLLLDADDRVLAYVELERLAAGLDRALIEFLTVARDARGRGLARMAKQCAVEYARGLRIRRLHTMNHVDNVAICALNEQLGWNEDPLRLSLKRDA